MRIGYRLSAQVGKTLFYRVRLGLEIGQVGFELGDLLGLALESSLESLVLALAAVATRTTTTVTAASTATASRVAIMVMFAVVLVAAIAFAVMPVMMFVVFVSLVGRHAQPSLSSQPVSDPLKLLPAVNFRWFLPCSRVGVGLAPGDCGDRILDLGLPPRLMATHG